MKFELKSLEPLESRKVIHSYQIIDNSEADGEVHLLVGDKNTFLFRKNNGCGYLSRPFEEELKDPIEDLVRQLRGSECAAIHFMGFPREMMNPFYFTLGEDATRNNWKLYQTPNTKDEYEAALKRFRNSGFSYRKLSTEDIPLIIRITEKWTAEKKQIALSRVKSQKIENIKTIEDQLNHLLTVKREIEWLDHMNGSQKDYEKLMSQILTSFYGTFRDGELLSYIQTEGNNYFQKFNSRASVRLNSCSPQEFLDYCVAREFAERGVKLFDRGWMNVRAGLIGLIEYKRKFGKIKPVMENNHESVVEYLTPENIYLKNLFNETL